MTDTATKSCPACFSSIDARATRCPACAQRQPDAASLHRDVPGRVAGGVCAMIAHHFNWDPTLMRIAFVASAVLLGTLTAWIYVAAWLMTPFEVNGKTPLVRAIDWLGALFSPKPGGVERVEADRVR